MATWIVGTPAASGHGIILESSPRHEETVAAPRHLTLRFNGRLEKRLCSVSLIGPGQSTILLLAQEADAPEDTLRFRLPILKSGSYRAKWKVLSSDGHVTEGIVVFSVREAGAAMTRPGGRAIETIPGMPPVVDSANLYSETGTAKLSAAVAGALPRVYVPNVKSNDVYVIDPATFKVVDRFRVGVNPQHVVPSYDLKTLWVTNNAEGRTDGSLTPIDPTTVRTRYNPFDLTKVWPHRDYPLVEVGVLELNRNPENYFADVEQAAFSPANVVPGISHSPDKMLRFRIVSYADAHRYRLGVNYESLPVNRPRVGVDTYHRDGAMRFDRNAGGSVNYEPNSFGGPVEDRRFTEPPLRISGDADRYDHRAGNDDYAQAGNLFRLMPADGKTRLFANIAETMRDVPDFIVKRQIEHFTKADPACGEGVAKALQRVS